MFDMQSFLYIYSYRMGGVRRRRSSAPHAPQLWRPNRRSTLMFIYIQASLSNTCSYIERTSVPL
jgi:hypothetical protein